MSSLKEQLEKLAVPHIQNAFALDTRRISLLFDAKEAATLDREYLFDLCINGFEEMCTIDIRFEKYEKMLFSRNYINFERSLQTKEINNKIDKLIKKFFIDVSPYFLLKPCLKMLEWLVYRYHIHIFNVDDWLITILPYHNTPTFVKVLTILKLEKTTNKWHWLHQSAKSGMPIPRQVLINQCQKNPGFLRSVCNLISLYRKHLSKDDTQHLHLVISLTTVVVLGVLKDSQNIAEEIVAIISSIITTGIASSLVDLKAAVLIMMGRLLHVANLKDEMLIKFAELIVQNLQDDLYTESIFCLNIILSKSNELNLHFLESFDLDDDNIEKLIQISEKFDIFELLNAIKTIKHTNAFSKLIPDLVVKKDFVQRLLDGEIKNHMTTLSQLEKENIIGLLGSKEKNIVIAVLDLDEELLDVIDIPTLTKVLLDLTDHLLSTSTWFKVIAKALHLLCLIDNKNKNPTIIIFLFSILTSKSSFMDFKNLCIIILKTSRIAKNFNINELFQLLNENSKNYKIYGQYLISMISGFKDLQTDLMNILNDFKWNNSLFGFKIFVILCFFEKNDNISKLSINSNDLMLIKICFNILSSFNFTKENNILKLNENQIVHLLVNSKPDGMPISIGFHFVSYLLSKIQDLHELNLIIEKMFNFAFTILEENLDHQETLSLFENSLEQTYIVDNIFDRLMYSNYATNCVHASSCASWLLRLVSKQPDIIFNSIANSLHLLIFLGHPQQKIRKEISCCLKPLKMRMGGEGDKMHQFTFFDKLLKQKEEFIADETFIFNTMGTIISSLNKKEMDNTLNDVFMILLSDNYSDNFIYLSLKLFSTSPLKAIFKDLNKLGEKYMEKLAIIDEKMSKNNITQENNLCMDIVKIIIDLILKNINQSSKDLIIVWQFLFQCYNIYSLNPNKPYTFLIASYLTNKILEQFNSLQNIENQRKIVSLLIDATLVAISQNHDNVFGCALKQLKIENVYISHELRIDVDEFAEPPAKIQRLVPSLASSPNKMKRLVIVLESLQGKHKYKEPTLMAVDLFSLLSKLELIEDTETDYCRLLTLTSLHLVFKSAIKKKVQLSEDILNIDAIMHCMHGTASAQTQQQILILLTDLIPIFPNYMLHNIVSVFTFMGSIIFQRDDAYSDQTIRKTIDVVVEAVLKNTFGTEEERKVKMLEVLHIFVDVRDHMPSHRRTPLFSHLIKQIASKESLFLLSILLIENSIKNKNTKNVENTFAQEEQSVAMTSCLEFIVNLFGNVAIDSQVDSLHLICLFIGQLFLMHTNEKEEIKHNKDLEVLDLKSLDQPQFRRLILFNLSKLVIMILARQELIVKVLELDESGCGYQIEGKLEKLVKECIVLLVQISEHQQTICKKQKSKSLDNELKFLPQLLKAITNVLEKINYLLSTKCFLEIINSLMLHENVSIKLKSLELLSSKLQQIESKNILPNETDNILLLMPQILSCLNIVDNDMQKTVDSVKQMCLFNIKLLCKIIGSTRPAIFLPTFSATTKIILEKDAKNISLVNSAMLCIAELSQTFKTHSLPYLQKFMPAFLEYAQDDDILNSELSSICLLSSLSKIVLSLSDFISPYVENLIIQTCILENKSNMVKYVVLQKPAIQDKLHNLRKKISTVVCSRVFLPNICKAYNLLLKTNQASLEFLCLMLKDHFDSLNKDEIQNNLKVTSEFFCLAVDLRPSCNQLNFDEILKVENTLIESFLALVLRLSENSFRPIFYKICDFEARENECLLTVFHLMNLLANKLKSIFNLFSSHLVKKVVQYLNDNNDSKEKVSFFGMNSIASIKSNFLLINIFGMLTSCFMFDSENQFINSSISQLFQPIVDQLENFIGGDEMYKDRTMNNVIPCLVEMAIASRDNSHLQLINYQVCLKMRHDNAMVRYSALRTVEEIATKLGNSYESLLPETATFISEALEDDCEEVEQECRRVKKALEGLLGDLTKFF